MGKSGGKQEQNTAIKIRLHPTAEQAELFEKTFGCCRWLWNHMLADAEEFYAATDLHYIPTPARYKKQAPFLKEADSQALCTEHQNLRRAYLNFFRNPQRFRRPRFKLKKARKDSFTVYCRQYRTGPSVCLTEKGVRMPKLGLIPARVHRRVPSWYLLRYVTVSKSKTGKYFCSAVFVYQAEASEQIRPRPERTLGLNYSLGRCYVDSRGESPVLPALEESREKLARMQRRLAGMVPNSQNYQKQLQKIRLLYEHMANARRDFAHKESRRIANAWDAVCLRELDLRALAQKLDQGGGDSGFGMFRQYLKYKLARQGKAYILVDQFAPTARTCSHCGQENPGLGSREKTWVCPCCGAKLEREVNGARNIRDMGLAQFLQKFDCQERRPSA